jgi:biofilm PGA synthesis N-glycosyltransferase PgaC
MEVPPSLRALWAQRKRWARGQGEVLHSHLRAVVRWRNRRMWLLSAESIASLMWVLLLALSLVVVLLGASLGALGLFGTGLAWGIAISVVATLQLAVALALRYPYDHWDLRSFLLGPLYPAAYWLISAAAALRCQALALIRGPREQRVVWDIEREAVQPEAVGPPPG